MHATGQTRTHAWSTTSMQGSAITKVILLASLSRDAEARHGPEVCLWSCPDIIPGQMTRGNAPGHGAMYDSPFQRGPGGQREATLREEPRLASLSPPLPPHGGKEGCSTRQGKQHT